ncbi:MAG: VTT domain-containing protein [bacterium]
METTLLLLLKYKYLVLFPSAVLEGPLVSLIVGFLIRTDVLSFWLSFLILILGDIIPDTIFYCIGYFGRDTKFVRKHITNSKFFSGHLSVIEKLWSNHGRKTMFLGKLAYGMALPFLVSAGLAKMPFKKFITYAVPVSVIQYGTIVLVGYLLGHSFQIASGYIGAIYYLLAAVVVISIVIYYLVMKYAQKKIILLVQEEETAKKEEV